MHVHEQGPHLNYTTNVHKNGYRGALKNVFLSVYLHSHPRKKGVASIVNLAQFGLVDFCTPKKAFDQKNNKEIK